MITHHSKSEQAVVFLHIIKTAGTTLHRIIERQYRPEQLYSVGLVEGESLEELAQLDKARKAKVRMLRGHISYGAHEFLPRPATYMTVLRDPVERVISHYYFILRTTGHYLYDSLTSEDINLQTFIENKTHVMIDNTQTRAISGIWNKAKFGECTREMLETAKRNLRKDFAVVGLTEKFDETLLLMKRTLGWQNVFYTRHNVTPRRPRRDALPPATLDAILEVNQLDIELYRYATTLFEEQIHQYGPSLASETKRFQSINRWISPLLWVYWQVRKVSVRVFVRRWIDYLHSRIDRTGR